MESVRGIIYIINYIYVYIYLLWGAGGYPAPLLLLELW